MAIAMPAKPLSKRLLLPLLLIACSLLLFAKPRPASEMVPAALGQFPAIQATSLEKTKLKLPQDFSGQLNLIVISFAREQQHQVDTWIATAQEIQIGHGTFSYYELSTLSSQNILYRWWFDAALRSNTDDKDIQSKILTAYVNKHRFLASLRIANEKHAVAVLVDRAGKVIWRGNGSCSSEDKAALLSTLSAHGI